MARYNPNYYPPAKKVQRSWEGKQQEGQLDQKFWLQTNFNNGQAPLKMCDTSIMT